MKNLDLTIEQLAQKEALSVRLYHCLIRYLCGIIVGKSVQEIANTVTIADICCFMLQNGLQRVRNMGEKTIKELYDVLLDYGGECFLVHAAINKHVTNYYLDCIKRDKGYPSQLAINLLETYYFLLDDF